MENELEIIKEKHPSICYNCKLSRKPASIENIKKGYVGCCLRTSNYDYYEILEAKEVAEGWVDLRSKFKLGKGSGIITNNMLLTLEVKECRQFKS